MTAAPIASPKGVAAPANTAERAQMQKVARQFEAVFLRQIIDSMRQADLAEGVFDSSATDQFRDMADAKIADGMAETGGFGIAELLMKQYDVQHGGVESAGGNKVVTVPVVDTGT